MCEFLGRLYKAYRVSGHDTLLVLESMDSCLLRPLDSHRARQAKRGTFVGQGDDYTS